MERPRRIPVESLNIPCISKGEWDRGKEIGMTLDQLLSLIKC